MNKALQIISSGCYDSFFLIAGPCAVESFDTCAVVAEQVSFVCHELHIPFIFKASIRKANRTKADSFTGIGDEESLRILSDIKERFDVAITTDVHEVEDIVKVKGIVDVIQIPAFLCRQTELLQAAGATGLPVNIKKGQFMSGEMMRYAVDKVIAKESELCFLTERGTTFGYQDLIVDTRNIAQMTDYATVVIDCTHSTQRPNQSTGITGGNSSEIELLARVGIAAGAKGVFMETHPSPSHALSDAASMLPLDQMKSILPRIHAFSKCMNKIYA